MDVRAAVAHEAGKKLTIEAVTLDGPRAGEVKATKNERKQYEQEAN